MSETPRTDTEARQLIAGAGSYQLVSANYARQLERELNAAQARMAQLEDDMRRLSEALARLIDSVPEPPLVLSADEPPSHRTAEEHELGYALHLAKIALNADQVRRMSEPNLTSSAWLPCYKCGIFTALRDDEGHPECMSADCVERRG